jgi:hypothetical protein
MFLASPSSPTSVSSFALTKVLVLAAVVGGCMKIYPDPELPDIVVNWEDFDCRDGTGDVRIAVVTYEGSDVIAETTVTCSTLTVTFKDVAREHYRVEGYLLDLDGEIFSSNQSEADLRDGISERVSMYFNAFANFRVAWMFETGTCASNGADAVEVELAYMGSTMFQTSAGSECQFTPLFATLPTGDHRVRLRALDYSTPNLATIALSPEIEVSIVENNVTDVGTLVLTPCGADCPDLP